MSPEDPSPVNEAPSAPRVSGDEPGSLVNPELIGECSPRERG